MAIGSRNPQNVLDYASGSAYIAALTPAGVAGTFELVGWTQGTKISTEVNTDSFEERDDSGEIVVSKTDESLKSAMVEGVYLERDASVRNSITASSVSSYCYVIVGASINPSKREVWVFPNVKYSMQFSYEIGGKARFPYKLTANTSLTGYTLTLPGGLGTTAIASGDVYKTLDV